jgi:hypothetical protein
MHVLIGVTAAGLSVLALSKAPAPTALAKPRTPAFGISVQKDALRKAEDGYCREARSRTLHSWWVAAPC